MKKHIKEMLRPMKRAAKRTSKPKTVADHFRAMTDEEIVAFAKKQIGCGLDYFPCGIVCEGKCESYDTRTCEAKIMAYLQQPWCED